LVRYDFRSIDRLMARVRNPWLGVGMSAWSLGWEASSVIALRTLKIAAGGPEAGAETELMIREKIDAAIALQLRAMTGGLGFTPSKAASKAVSHLRRKVRANRRRLSKA
jgi:hypothetical protein